MAQYPQRPGEADNCRDFLRTGRCKYGESCKYHHPPNVQSGGGVRAPLDPTEPPFPIRPSEPPCQYYLKHGTCKFGQTCKFHHPPMSPKQSAFLGTATSSTMSLLSSLDILLPQRPTEPDCIYFLRNGRCKYGATCKYHHPLQLDDNGLLTNKVPNSLHGHAPLRPRDRSQSSGSMSDQGGGLGLGNGAIPICHVVNGQGHPAHGATHIILNDGTIAVMINPGHHRQGGNSANDFNNRHQSHSSSIPAYSHSTSGSSPLTYSPAFSSVSSSYETASSLELLGRGHSVANNNGGHPETMTLSKLEQNYSSGSLSQSHQADDHPLTPIAGSYHREPGSYRESEYSPSRRRMDGMDRMNSARSLGDPNRLAGSTHSPDARGWVGDNSGPLSPSARIWDRGGDVGSNTMRASGRHGGAHDNSYSPGRLHASSSVPSNLSHHGLKWETSDHDGHVRGRLPETLEGNWEDGLSNMTSALLNMLDTPEEHGHHNEAFRQQAAMSASTAPGRRTMVDSGMPPTYPQRGQSTSSSQYGSVAGPSRQRTSLDFFSEKTPESPNGVNATAPPSLVQVSPSWQPPSNQQLPPNSSSSSNVGLYLS